MLAGVNEEMLYLSPWFYLTPRPPLLKERGSGGQGGKGVR